MLRGCLAGAFVVIVTFCSAAAGPFEDGLSAYNSGNYETALRLFRPMAGRNDARAQYNLGLMYYYGDGVLQDDSEAIRWFRLSAEQGFAAAQDRLGTLYAFSPKLHEDFVAALKWYHRAADQGYAGAEANLGGAYAHGHGVPQDFGEAMKWYRLAGEHGHADAQVVLGMTYRQGWQGGDDWHGPRDYGEAAKWYRLAADQDEAWAQNVLGEMYRDGQGVPQDSIKAHMWLTLAISQKPPDIGPATRALGLNAGGLDEELRETVRRKLDTLSATMTSEEIAEAKRLAENWKKQRLQK